MREDLLRPCKGLGYSYETLACHLISRESYRIAALLLRRAVWLNPYEIRFKQHLAACLFLDKRYADARVCAQEALKQEKGNRVLKELLERIDKIDAAVKRKSLTTLRISV